MSPVWRLLGRFVGIGIGFGLVFAAMQYANGNVRDFGALAGSVLLFAAVGVILWAMRLAVEYFRRR
jgi:membrane protein CcdC involved in cytochrome C biogenesis